MVMFVYGFPNKIAALQFEHAWQHPYQTRHIEKNERITNSKTAGRSYAHKLGNSRLLLKSDFFNRMNLKVKFFNSEAFKIWYGNKFGIHVKMDIRSISHSDIKSGDDEANMSQVKNFKAKVLEEDEVLMKSFEEVLKGDELECSICHKEIDYLKVDNFELISICYHTGCHNLTHLSCLRGHIYQQKQNLDLEISQKRPKAFELPVSELIPNTGECPSCRRSVLWSELVAHSTRIKHLFGHEDNQHDTIEEEDNFEENFEDNDLLQSQKQLLQ